MKKLLFVVLLISLFCSGNVYSAVLTFEDLPDIIYHPPYSIDHPHDGEDGPMPSDYKGFNWDTFYWYDKDQHTGSSGWGFHLGCDGYFAVFNAYGNNESLATGVIIFNGANIAAAYGEMLEEPMPVTVSGYLNNVLQHAITIYVDENPVSLNFGYLGPVDRLDFETYGQMIVMDNFTYNSVPIENTLEFFNQSVDDGTIEGFGRGNSATGRLNAFGNMLEMAVDLIYVDDIDGACGQLKAALKKCDGQSKPRDFITGDAATELHTMILELMEGLGCE